MPTDVFNPAVEADFHYAGGHIIGASGRGNFGGHLRVGDVSGSGRVEVGSDAVSLLDPYGAEIMDRCTTIDRRYQERCRKLPRQADTPLAD